MRYMLGMSGQATAQRAQNILMTLRPPIFSEVKHTTNPGGCSWGVEVETNDIDYIIRILAEYRIAAKTVRLNTVG
ncbi:MAG: hypothetical protein LBM87_03825 [Ruminococcus sp.]|jgi:hypothetical protein|nr:hypothetical protein [Ruminococcus sp.]